MVPHDAWAAKSECASPNAICATPVKQGQAAPYSGQLVTPTLAVRLGQGAGDCNERVNLAIARVVSLAAIELKAEHATRMREREALTAELKTLQEHLANADKVLEEAKPPFYERPWFVAPVVAVGTAVAVVAAFNH